MGSAKNSWKLRALRNHRNIFGGGITASGNKRGKKTKKKERFGFKSLKFCLNLWLTPEWWVYMADTKQPVKAERIKRSDFQVCPPQEREFWIWIQPSYWSVNTKKKQSSFFKTITQSGISTVFSFGMPKTQSKLWPIAKKWQPIWEDPDAEISRQQL